MKEAEIYAWIIGYVILGVMLVHSEISERKLRKKRGEIFKSLLRETFK